MENMDLAGHLPADPQYVDWGMKSAHPDIRHITGHLSSLMAEARHSVSGPASEIIEHVEDTTASQFANETNRVIRLTANGPRGPVEFDLVIQLAAPTTHTATDK